MKIKCIKDTEGYWTEGEMYPARVVAGGFVQVGDDDDPNGECWSAAPMEYRGESLYVKADDVLALVEALELKEEQRANWSQMAQKLGEDLDAAEKRIAETESSGIASGILRCTECSFVLTKNIISVTADTITTGISEPEPCPNGCGQLQPVTWKALAIQLMFTTKQGLWDLLEAKKRIAELEREQEHLRPVGVMSEQAFHRLENSECRFIALWPRPGIFLQRKRPEDGVLVYARTAAAAGIKKEAE
ncbi:hypothetical protein NW256_06110 [Klebsiella pneumoniae]|uniref:hypothetical protein n=1 Tax=Klebsiella pneumoniae TaxID=573 RepID=UPI001F3596D1|nr:hypothetical protein [Klebsiella pneumoniae]MCT4359061.1 hypothetical protein [Klebsiella pneumoniae]